MWIHMCQGVSFVAVSSLCPSVASRKMAQVIRQQQVSLLTEQSCHPWNIILYCEKVCIDQVQLKKAF